MASVTFTGVTLIVESILGIRGVRGAAGSSDGRFADSTGYTIPDGLKGTGVTGDVFLRLLEVRDGAFSALRTSTTDAGSGSVAGPELSDAWESNATAITITRGSNSVIVGGPNAPGSLNTDSSEPYLWRLSSVQQAEVRAFVNAVGVGTYSDFTITLDDGRAAGLLKGTTELDALYRGSDQVVRAYKGETLIFGSEP